MTDEEEKAGRIVMDLLKRRRFVGFAMILVLTAVVVVRWGLPVTLGMISYSCVLIYVLFRVILGADVEIILPREDEEVDESEEGSE